MQIPGTNDIASHCFLFLRPNLEVVKNPNHQAALTKVRISAHKYPIETGRYMKLKREERECLCVVGKFKMKNIGPGNLPF